MTRSGYTSELSSARDHMNQLEDAARVAASVGAEAMRTARADVLHIAAVLRALEMDRRALLDGTLLSSASPSGPKASILPRRHNS